MLKVFLVSKIFAKMQSNIITFFKYGPFHMVMLVLVDQELNYNSSVWTQDVI